MDFQLYAGEEGFFLLANKISRDLETLETCATGNANGGNPGDHEILKKEIRRIAPELKGLRLNCLCLTLSAPYRNQSASFFKTLERLNVLIEQFEGYNQELSPSVQSQNNPGFNGLNERHYGDPVAIDPDCGSSRTKAIEVENGTSLQARYSASEPGRSAISDRTGNSCREFYDI